jgi:hypothetical protein
MILEKLFRHRALHMLGDCGHCGHSIMYHAPLFGCGKCSCEEFS